MTGLQKLFLVLASGSVLTLQFRCVNYVPGRVPTFNLVGSVYKTTNKTKIYPVDRCLFKLFILCI